MRHGLLYFGLGFFTASLCFGVVNLSLAQSVIKDVPIKEEPKSDDFVFDYAVMVDQLCTKTVSSTTRCTKIEPEYQVYFKNAKEKVVIQSIDKARYEKLSKTDGALFNPVIFEYTSNDAGLDIKNGNL